MKRWDMAGNNSILRLPDADEARTSRKAPKKGDAPLGEQEAVRETSSGAGRGDHFDRRLEEGVRHSIRHASVDSLYERVRKHSGADELDPHRRLRGRTGVQAPVPVQSYSMDQLLACLQRLDDAERRCRESRMLARCQYRARMQAIRRRAKAAGVW